MGWSDVSVAMPLCWAWRQVCRSVLQCIAETRDLRWAAQMSVLQRRRVECRDWQQMCCSVLQRVAACCSVLQRISVQQRGRAGRCDW